MKEDGKSSTEPQEKTGPQTAQASRIRRSSSTPTFLKQENDKRSTFAKTDPDESPTSQARALIAQRSGPIIKKIEKAIEEKRPYYSFEYFPPKTNAGVTNLFSRMERMSTFEPLFIDVTWGAGGSTKQLSLDISATAQQFGATEVMMHLTCTDLSIQDIREALEHAKAAGIRNILALRGEPPHGVETWEVCEGGFEHAIELVRFIRKEFGDYFGIAVAGYPEGHVSALSLDDDVTHLKAKIDAGADFVLTQLFYDVELYLQWVQKCRAAGISCPLIPGIMPIQSFNGFKRMTSFCKTHVPQSILKDLQPMQHDDAKVKQYGIDLGIRMCNKLLENGVPGFHFYTLNLERSVTRILEGLGFVNSIQNNKLPWKQSVVSRRKKEDVRPIFWANRPNSYLDRTVCWDDFPNGRWGDSASPAFGELSDYYLCSVKTGSLVDRRRIWGAAPTQPKHVYEVFSHYVDGKIPRLPWCENPIQLETVPIKNCLRRMNMNGFLTINSQPKVNGAPSSDPAVGWGSAGGYVYQKAYLEFFCSPANLEKLTKLADSFPSLLFTACNIRGDIASNSKFDNRGRANAVTWGVFPGREIIQPTVVDTQSFLVWKDEAFALWRSQWQQIYEKESSSADLIQRIHDTFFLVNVVDNDYIGGDIFAFFDKLMLLD